MAGAVLCDSFLVLHQFFFVAGVMGQKADVWPAAEYFSFYEFVSAGGTFFFVIGRDIDIASSPNFSLVEWISFSRSNNIFGVLFLSVLKF